MDRPEGKPHPRFFRLLMAGITLALVSVMLLSVIQFAPVKAFTPTFCVGSGAAGGQTATSTITAGTTSASTGALPLATCGTTGTAFLVTFYWPLQNVTTGQVVSSITVTDNNTDVFTALGGGNYITCSNSASAGACPKNHPGNVGTVAQLAQFETFGTQLVKPAGHLNITFHYASATYTATLVAVYSIFSGASITTSTVCSSFFGSAVDSTLIYGLGYNDYCTGTIPSGGVALQAGMYNVNAGNTFAFSPGTSVSPTEMATGVQIGTVYCVNALNICQFYQAYEINSQNTPISMGNFGWAATSTGGGLGNWMSENTIVLVPSAGVTSTTTINTNCLGGCSGGSNGTSIYLPPPTSTFFNLHFYASVNLQTPSQVDNVTFKVAAVHITAATGLIYVCVWAANGVASGGNPYTLVQACNGYVLTNGTSNFFVHSNPQANLGANQSYAVGIMTTTTASRGSGASGSGISIYQTSQAGITEYKYSVGSSTPPTTFFSNVQQTPHDWIYIHTTFPVVLLTTTLSTATITISGTLISTIFSTTTMTTLNMNLAVQNGTDYAIILLVLLFPAMALMVPIAIYTKSAPGAAIGFVAGLMIGSAIAVQASLVPPVFLGIMVIVGIFMIVGLMYGSRGST